MIVVADTLIYIGALGDVFNEARYCLKVGGLFIFSVEDLESSPMKRNLEAVKEKEEEEGSGGGGGGGGRGSNSIGTPGINSSSESQCYNSNDITGAVPGWGCQLLESARFAHSHHYIAALTAKHAFTVVLMEQVVLRTENTVALNGNMYVLQRSS